MSKLKKYILKSTTNNICRFDVHFQFPLAGIFSYKRKSTDYLYYLQTILGSK